MAKEPKKLIANNKKVYHDYFLDEKYEAGISLAGTEVKSLRMGKGSIKEAFIRIENGEVYLYGMHITPYEKGNIFNKDPLRPKKLLLHKKEIEKLTGKIKEKGYELLDKIREMRNYWCHRCYIDFHYIEDEKEHYEAFLKVAEQLCHDENCIYELQQKIEKLRKSVVRKYKYRK